MTDEGLDPILVAFDRLVETDPGQPLVISGGRSITRAEVAALASKMELRLARLPTDRHLVGLSAANGAGFLAGLLALRRTDRAALLLDQAVPEASSVATAAEMGARNVLFAFEATSGSVSFEILSLDGASLAPQSANRFAVVKLTSGTTGSPRGILTTSEALVADDQALAKTMGLTANERILAAIPMSHSYGLSSVVMPALMRGSQLVVPQAAGPFAAFEACSGGQVTFLPTVPAYLSALLSTAKPPELPNTVRLIISAGAPLEPRVAADFRRAYGRPVQVFYGASECGGICFDREGSAGERGTVGAPVEGVHVRVEPTEDKNGYGRVAVLSPAVATAYHPPESNLEGGRFLTGDLAAWRGNELALVGRIDDLINVRGKKVNPRTIEAVLRRLPGVSEAAVFGLDSEGGSGPLIHAVVACSQGQLDLTTIRSFCRDRLGRHQVPRSFTLVAELPRTGRGKIDYRAAERLAISRPQ